MKFVIQGKEYPRANVGALSLWDIKELQRQTGLTVKQLEADAEYLEQFEEPEDLFSDMKAVDLLGTFIWLARFTHGDRVSFEESMQVPFDEIDVVPDAEDEEPAEPEPDPTVLPLPPVGAAAEADEADAVVAGV